jgi:predicted glycogen debranching enzyme
MRTIVQPGWRRGDSGDALITREWIITNGLGGYASGTIGGVATRRFHGILIAALPAPLGRTNMFNVLEEELIFPDGSSLHLNGEERRDAELRLPELELLDCFELRQGLPVWNYRMNGYLFEKRLSMPFLQNTVHCTYRLLEGSAPITLRLRPFIHFRPHEGLVDQPLPERHGVNIDGNRTEISGNEKFPPLRLMLFGSDASMQLKEQAHPHLIFRLERARGYEYEGPIWSPGFYEITLAPGSEVTLAGSTEEWAAVAALKPHEVVAAEGKRVDNLVERAGIDTTADAAAQLVIAADQFIITPHMRTADAARAHAVGEELRTIIAGYHWFTDWGRDTMISLEGLTLTTGRYREAESILRTFASYVRDGLIPNMFPEGNNEGLYHTADASLWFFHALDRYVQHSGDRETLRLLLPKMHDIIDHHVRGTRFGIGVDPADGLLREGAPGYQLTWMDAKVDDWVVTPRRGKPVEINALFYNALRTLEAWSREENDAQRADELAAIANRVHETFNRRFWYDEGGYLYDVVDDEGGSNDPALRPNQIFSISLRFPVLERSRWERVMSVVQRELLTPVGLRSLGASHPDYKARYDGDLRARDAAYHQGTVWGWLIGPFIDAWLKVNEGGEAEARHFLDGLIEHMGEAGIGTISEVFDATAPYTPRGCIAQAWSVAEVLRCLLKTSATRERSSSVEMSTQT